MRGTHFTQVTNKFVYVYEFKGNIFFMCLKSFDFSLFENFENSQRITQGLKKTASQYMYCTRRTTVHARAG